MENLTVSTLFDTQPGYRSDLLVEHGFFKEKAKGKYRYNEEKKKYEPVSGKIDRDDADEHETELMFGEYLKTGYPMPLKAYRLSWEVFDLSLEEPYFWVLNEFKSSFPIVEKLEDSFAAAENSAFFGVTQQRLGAQQDKVSQFLATIGKMIKELFQMVRELRIIDERMQYYNEVLKQIDRPIAQRSKSAEITLKGYFVDLVQGGGKSPASVYGMARELEFITLPDLFFDAPPFRTVEELDTHLKGLEKDFNRNVIRVLARHLRQYMEWRTRTHKEHESRRRFQLAYLRQHFDIIKMYVNWVKPYLRHVARLHMKEKNMSAPDLISAFEGSMLDIEVMARKRVKGERHEMNSCILAAFSYRTRPEMKVVQEGYQRGPVHIGRFEMNLRLYAWTDEEVERYKRMKEQELKYLMMEVSGSVEKAMVPLGEELDRYLLEAEGKGEKKEEAAAATKSIMEKLFGDFYHSHAQKAAQKMPKVKKPSKKDAEELAALRKKAWEVSWLAIWNIYHNFKKAHRLVAW